MQGMRGVRPGFDSSAWRGWRPTAEPTMTERDINRMERLADRIAELEAESEVFARDGIGHKFVVKAPRLTSEQTGLAFRNGYRVLRATPMPDGTTKFEFRRLGA